MVTLADVRRIAESLPRSYEVLVGGRVKFRVGRLVYLSFSRDETVMGFAFPKEEREWLIGGSPDKFMRPTKSDLRYNWVLVRLIALDQKEMRELVLDACAHGRPERSRAESPHQPRLIWHPMPDLWTRISTQAAPCAASNGHSSWWVSLMGRCCPTSRSTSSNVGSGRPG